LEEVAVEKPEGTAETEVVEKGKKDEAAEGEAAPAAKGGAPAKGAAPAKTPAKETKK
jgi:hypothetical protein